MDEGCSFPTFAYALNAFSWLIRLYNKFSLKLQKFTLQNYSWENATFSPDYLQQK